MKRYQRIGYIIMAGILLVLIILIILIHSFNSTPESGITTTTTKSIEYGS